MKQNIDEAWIEKMAALEEGCSVSAGSPLAFFRDVEVHHAIESAKKERKPFAVFMKGDEPWRMRWSDWLKCVRYGIAQESGYRLHAKVTPTGKVIRCER